MLGLLPAQGLTLGRLLKAAFANQQGRQIAQPAQQQAVPRAFYDHDTPSLTRRGQWRVQGKPDTIERLDRLRNLFVGLVRIGPP